MDGGGEIDTGAYCLAMIARFHSIAADPAQIAHQHAPGAAAMDVRGLVRGARDIGLKARAGTLKLAWIYKAPLPAIAEAGDGSFFILARADSEKALIQAPGRQPETLGLEALSALWTGRVVLVARRAALAGEARRFDITWFIPAIVKYRRMFAEVLLASFFLQIFGLITPLFFQVIIDKVLVHRGLTTLDVLVIGLLAVTLFEVVLGGLRTYIFSHTTSRVTCRRRCAPPPGWNRSSRRFANGSGRASCTRR